MSNQIIPKSFQVLGHKYRISYKNDLGYNDGCLGRINFSTKDIHLQPFKDSYPVAPTEVEQTYCHELVHLILKESHEDCYDPPLHSREALVDRIASVLHQILKTSKYEK